MATFGFYTLILLCIVAGLYQLTALAATLLYMRRRDPPATHLRPISILKPVQGLDPGFYEAIRSHASQDYAEFELLFGVADAADPAVPEIQRLQAEFPQLRIELIHCADRALNPKVSKLAELLPHARYPVILVNDSDIRVQPGYLRRIIAPLDDPEVGLVTCLYRVSASGFPARWAAMGVATDFAPSTLVAPAMGVKEFALGSTLLFRAEDLKRIGGYEAFGHYVADDYQIAKRITALGKRVHLSTEIVQTSIQESSWAGVWKHQVRWQKMIRVSRSGGYIGLPVTFATLWALLAVAAGAWTVAAALLSVRMIMALTAGLGAVRCPATARLWPLIPLRDLWGAAVWAAALFGRTVRWRGALIRLTPQGRIQS